jgi:DNA-binding transcriptional regulator LsrR (DeoR family)
MATVRLVALPLSMGYSTSEVARSIGISRSSVERLVARAA